MVNDQADIKRRRGIYLLPNLFTTAGLFAGFYAIVAAMKGHFSIAAIAIFIAMIADGLDGRVARMTNTESDFGAEYDSLADVVAFGLAPSLVIYHWSLMSLGKPGWLAAFIYTAAGALRLARFNTQLGNADKHYFQGLPIPAAAASMASLVWTAHNYHMTSKVGAIAVAIYTLIIAGLMVSNVRYYSFKSFNLKNRVPFVALLLVVLIFVAVSIEPSAMLFIVFLAYGISGPVLTTLHMRKARQLRKMQRETK